MKAKKILTRLHNFDVLDIEILGLEHVEIYEAIAELEAQETKSCEGCKHKNTINLEPENTINGYCLENGFFTKLGFCCNKHERKGEE